MTNELLLVVSLIIEYSLVVISYRCFGKVGLFVWMAVASILSNIEVLILVNAFGLEMTLGNILFASTFLATDILSENHGKETAKKAVIICIASELVFVLLTLSWALYIPSANDVSYERVKLLFIHTPRIVLSSITVFAVVQFLDVYLYHRIWDLTKKNNPSKKYLWLRNNAATIFSQIVNAVLYNVLAFKGIYPKETVISLIISTIIISVATSLADTPFLYWARSMKDSSAANS